MTRATYDANDNLATITDALNGVTRLTYDAEDTLLARTDANDHTTQFAYDRDGLLIKLIEAGGQVSRFAYDPTHNLTSFTNAKGNAWVFVYDALNRRITTTDPLAHATGYSYDALSRMVAMIDANRITTGYRYDALDRLVAVVQNQRPGIAADHQTNVTTGYTYDPVSNLTAMTDANGETTAFSYDLLDRLTKEVNPLGRTWLYGYDPVGNRTQRTDANGILTTYTYDADDLLTRIGYPDASGVSFAYDAVHNQTAMTDTLGLTRNEYDALNRMTASTNHVGQRVGSAYDPVGNRTALTYPDGRIVRYAYDPTDFAITVTDPDGNVFNVTRDPTHNIVRVENPNQTLVERDIDAAERLTAVRNLTSQNPHEVISNFTYTLDPVGNRTRVESVFRWRKPEQLNYDYRYDPLYRLVRSDDSEGHFTTYGYDAVGNRTRHETNDDPTLVRKVDTVTTTASYDAANQLITSVRAVAPRGNADRTLQTAQALRAFSHEVAAQRGKHLATATTDSLLTQAEGLINNLEGDKAPDEAATATALSDLRSAVTTARDNGQINNSGTANSLLVKLGQAEEANGRRGPELHTTLYDYDKNGNRVRRTAPNEGTATEKDWLKTDYTYDFENRLVHVQDFHTPGVPGNGAWLPMDETMVKFDGYGRVFRRQHDQHIGGGGDQEWNDYVYDGLDPIAEYRNPSPQYTNYYRGLGHILSQHDFKSQQSPVGTLYYYHYDGLDSVVGMTKHIGQSVHNYRYHDYGIMLDINGKAADASNFTDPHNHYTYTGQEWDEHIDLYHFYARDYEPATGVWLQQDPYRGRLAEPKTLHRYGYVGGNPVTYIDNYGYVANVLIGAGVGALVGGVVSGGVNAYNQWKTTGSINLKQVGVATAGGAVVGGAVGACIGSVVCAAVASNIARATAPSAIGYAVVNATANASSQMILEHKVDFSKVGAAAAGGFVQGIVCTVKLLCNSVGSFLGGATEQAINDRQIKPVNMFTNGLTSMAGNAIPDFIRPRGFQATRFWSSLIGKNGLRKWGNEFIKTTFWNILSTPFQKLFSPNAVGEDNETSHLRPQIYDQSYLNSSWRNYLRNTRDKPYYCGPEMRKK